MTEQVDVVVAGAGLAGLAAAVRLVRAKLDVRVVEAADRPGGRVRTDTVDGLLLDRGFQLLNPSYPEARRVLDLGALGLQLFRPGAAVRTGDGLAVLADPLRWPASLPGTLRAPIGSLRERVALVRWAAEIGFGPAARIKRRPDETLSDALNRRGVDGALRRMVLEPFLSGVLAEDELGTSRRVGELFIRAFVRGTPGLPERGMAQMPEQLAAALPDGVLRLRTRVEAVQASTVHTEQGSVSARAVVVACDPTTAYRLLNLPAPRMRALTTFYHCAATPPTDSRLLHVDGTRSGPVVNTAVVSNAAPTYTSGGRALIASTVLGVASEAREPEVRAHAARIYGVDAGAWEHVATYPIPEALPAMPPGQPLRRPVDLGGGVFIAGDHRDTPSIQGALVSGRRAADAVLTRLRF